MMKFLDYCLAALVSILAAVLFAAVILGGTALMTWWITLVVKWTWG